MARSRERVDDADDGMGAAPPGRNSVTNPFGVVGSSSSMDSSSFGGSSSNNNNGGGGQPQQPGNSFGGGGGHNMSSSLEDNPDLVALERRLNEEVDEDFFEDPRRFNTLPRVIDVLGIQMIDDATVQESHADMVKNPAYQQLKAQQKVVEDAIEHMAVIHCADLNASVIQVGRVARQFSEAVLKVRHLRKQVRDIQDSLGASASSNAAAAQQQQQQQQRNTSGVANPNEAKTSTTSRAQNAASMSLRELWLKKLECEATLALLDRLDIIRAAPARFDHLVGAKTSGSGGNNTTSSGGAVRFSAASTTGAPCRIGAATLCICEALQTMFCDDVAQVQALHKIMEQLMLRKQRAEEIVFDSLADVVYLRTGNGLALEQQQQQQANSGGDAYAVGGDSSVKGGGGSVSGGGAGGMMSSGHSVSSEYSGRRSNPSGVAARGGAGGLSARRGMNSNMNNSSVPWVKKNGMINPFMGKRVRYAMDEDLDNSDQQSVQSDVSRASLFSLEEGDELLMSGGGSGASASTQRSTTVPSGAASVGSQRSHEGAGGGAGSVGSSSKHHGAASAIRVMIPIPQLQAELDLENDERRCQEEIALQSGMMMGQYRQQYGSSGRGTITNLRHLGGRPRYADPVVALRILVECLARLKRLDDVERIFLEGLELEIRNITQREQTRTFARLEKKRLLMPLRSTAVSNAAASTAAGATGTTAEQEQLKEFRRHMTGLMSAFGCVIVRLSHLAQILRFRIGGDRELMQKIDSPSSVLRSVLVSAHEMMQGEIKEFLKACVDKVEGPEVVADTTVGTSGGRYEQGLFSLGIIEAGPKDGDQTVSKATRSNVMEMSTGKFVTSVLMPKTKCSPQARHALSFRRSVARWTAENLALRKELAMLTGEDTSSYNAPRSDETAIGYLDRVIQNELLPVLQEEAVNGTVLGLERRDAFDPVLDRTLYTRQNSNEPQDVDMCKACRSLYVSTGPLFLALHRLPRGGEMYLPLVAVLEHVMLTFISRVKQQVAKICEKKTAYTLLLVEGKDTSFSSIVERRKPFALLVRAYSDGGLLDSTGSSHVNAGAEKSSFLQVDAPTTDTAPRQAGEDQKSMSLGEDVVEGVDGEEMVFEQELSFAKHYLEFASDQQMGGITVCSDEELMKAATLAHSLMKLASLLDSRLKIRTSSGFNRPLTSTRALREAIKTIMLSGIKMAKFCRLDMLMQSISRLSKVCKSSTIVARDAVRIPSSVNDLGEYLTGASDNLREAAGNAVTAYTFSSLEQYIPLCLMQTVRVIAEGKGIITKSPLTMNGIEALDRSGSVLYRDLKGATSFDNSFWDVELAAISFERSASFMAMMELEMEELVAYYTANCLDFPEEDFILMFSMTGPRRRGDVGRFHMMKRRLKK